jgi:isopentenyl diphosphate isomerase/L-lactate dehydrogenase-like FMN-dependent dehydrogenase
MRNNLERAWAAGMKTLVFTADLPAEGSRYRDRHSGMSGPFSRLRQYIQAVMHPIGRSMSESSAARSRSATARLTPAAR